MTGSRAGAGRLVSAKGTMLYGGDYNPEQWPEAVWAEDMALFKQAHINEVTLNVFSWAALQPSEDEYDFSRLDRIVETASQAGLSIVMATSTAALPAWLCLRHPDVNRTDFHGRPMRHNGRHNACPNSPTYQQYSVALADKLAERYSALPNLVGWHVSNEYGGFCWCDNCAQAFRDWLRARYHNDIKEVNQAWNLAFWSHTLYGFDEIFPPNALADGMEGTERVVFPGLSLDYRRFFGQSVLDSYRAEKAAIRAHDRLNPVTTNLMGTFPDYDYFTWRDDLDVVAWDSYPQLDTSPAEVAFRHELMRGVGGGRPFMLMEQTPSRQNWMPYCSQKRPGQMRQQSWQAVAHGADTVQFFQLRQSRSACEKFHGAVIGSDGSDQTRTFREVSQLGAELERLSPEILGSQPAAARVAVIFDWNCLWGLQMSVGPTILLDYTRQVVRWYSQLHQRGIAVDVISAKDQLAAYDLVLAPHLYMSDATVNQSLRDFVQGGGRLLLTTMSLLSDPNDSLWQGQIPVPLRDLVGVWVEETDALGPDQTVPLSRAAASSSAAGAPEFGSASILVDVLHADEGTQVLASYAGEYYAGLPALTFRPSTGGRGQGGVAYCAFVPDDQALAVVTDCLLDGFDGLTSLSASATGTPAAGAAAADQGIELVQRVKPDGTRLTFLINPADREQTVTSPVSGLDLLSDAVLTAGQTVVLAPFGVAIVRGSD